MAETHSTPKNLTFILNNDNLVPEKYVESLLKEKCPLCLNFRSSFCCEKCIGTGNFASTTEENGETFATKNKIWVQLQEDKEKAAAMCREVLKRRDNNAQLPEEISECSERIRTLKHMLQEKREAVRKTRQALDTAREKNKTREKRMPRYRERVEKLASYVHNNMRTEITERKTKLELKKTALKSVVQKNIQQLVRYVFPIVKINPTSKSIEEEDSEVVSALAEASKTSFVRGTWVLMDSSGELHHQIVAPTLPGSGDYSAFMAVENENGVPIQEQIGSNEAYNIGAALCYTTQLVNLLAFYLDVILPKKVSYVDFSLRELTKTQFHRKVARLNTNVLYLCFSQGMDSVLLNPKHTLNNILNLVHHADLGQSGPFQVDSGLILSLECVDSAPGDPREEGSDDEEGEGFPWEWEAIPLVACPESLPGVAMSSTQATSSIAGGLVTSLASMFRGWTK